MFLELKKNLSGAIASAAGIAKEEAFASIELPKGKFGDVASSICFSLAKKEKKSPVALAQEISKKIKLPDWVSTLSADGPYLNFTLSDSFYQQLVLEISKSKGKFGKGKPKKGKTIIEFPSVNPNKPWHIGHLRNALLGDSVARILEFCGETVERADYIDDLGLQVAQSFWGYSHLGKKPSGKLDLWLGGQYVEVSKRFESEEGVQKEVRELLKKMEEGEGNEAQECRALVEKCVAAQYETAFKFSVFHDLMVFESDVVKTIFEEGMEMLKRNGAIVKETEGKNAGCFVAKMASEEFASMESPDKVLIRSDGTATYTGKDVIFQLWKFGLLKREFSYSKFMEQPNGKECFMTDRKGKKGGFGKATRAINVIGMEQAYPQKVIKEILLGMGYGKEAENSVHLAYEHVWLQEEAPKDAGQDAGAEESAKKFSGRQGTWIGYTTDELYDEGVRRAAEKIKEETQGKGKIASSIAASAIRFSFLRTSPEKKITFRWDSALSLEGDSAPYIIYAHARANKIIQKAGHGKASEVALEESERALLNKLMLFGWEAQEAARHLRPHLLADYCIEVATLYNRFYNCCPIISCEDEKVKNNRLAINFAAKTVLASALSLLGIEALEAM
jgi:arginyl-tRNA synthetase